MRITAVVPTRGNPASLGRCLQSLRKQSRRIEEIIVVSPPNDPARKVAKDFECRWVEDRKNTIGNAYNAGAAAAKGDIIVFTDDDCTAPRSWAGRLASEIEKGHDVAGGDDVIDWEKSTEFQRAAFLIDEARARGRSLHGKQACRRLRACNIAFRKEVFRKQNFNENLRGLQEPEFLHRLQKGGRRIKFNPGIKVNHTRRDSLHGVFSQIYRNGKARVELLRLHGDMASFMDAAPAAMVAYTAAMAYLSASEKAFALLWLLSVAAYFILKSAAIALKTGKPSYFPHLAAITATRETAYVLGFLAGLKSLFRRPNTS